MLTNQSIEQERRRRKKKGTENLVGMDRHALNAFAFISTIEISRNFHGRKGASGALKSRYEMNTPPTDYSIDRSS